MAKILLAWELGGGLGHVGPLRAIGAELVQRGHTVAIATAVGNVELCNQALVHTGIEVLPAPTLPPAEKRIKLPCTYADILHDCGYSSAENVTWAVGQWLQLFDWYRPGLLLADHSPTPLLANCLSRITSASLGVSFACPADRSPLPSLRKEILAPHWGEEVERTVLDSMNAAIAAHQGECLDRVTEIFARADKQYLLTLRELDQYAQWRETGGTNCEYWPPVVTLPGPICEWPIGSAVDSAGPRVFVYLRDNDTLLPLLRGLAYKRISTVCVAPRMDAATQASFAGSSVLVRSSPIELRGLTATCDVAVLNGGHGTVCEFLRAGVPMLLLPLSLEQQVTADRLKEIHSGLSASPEDLNAVGAALEKLLADASFQESARTLAQRYQHVTEESALSRLANSIEELLTT